MPCPGTRSSRCALGALALVVALLAFAPAAGADVVWLCRPGMADNPCEIGNDTTVREAGQADRVETPASGPREIDCFYVYPTVSNQPTPNANKDRDPELESIAKFQAARFSQECRVFAPVYRQATLASIAATSASVGTGVDRQLAYGDVLEAWRAYLRDDNGGRGVVLIGHSQGTSMLRQLIRREVEATEQKRRVVSALLIGANVTVKAGELLGGDFRETPLCTRPAQVRCVVAYSTFAKDPPADARFGISRTPPADNPSTLPGGPGYEVACTDPRPLAGVDGPLRSLTPTEPYAPGIIAAGIAITAGGAPPTAPTTWVIPPDRFEGGCKRINGAHVLRYDPLPGSRRPNDFPDETWGTHLVDVNLGYEPLVTLVGRQARRWTAPSLRLTHRCTSRGLRVRVDGPEADFVRDVNFKLGKRLVARDTRGAFERVLGRRALRRSRARTVRAVAYLSAGAPQRLVLERRRPRC